jgi:hypothetical protein
MGATNNYPHVTVDSEANPRVSDDVLVQILWLANSLHGVGKRFDIGSLFDVCCGLKFKAHRLK